MQGLLEPDEVEDHARLAEVRQLSAPRAWARSRAATCRDGVITRGVKVRLIRGDVVYDGRRSRAPKRFKRTCWRSKPGFECGIVLGDFADVKEGDVLEVYETRQVERELT